MMTMTPDTKSSRAQLLTFQSPSRYQPAAGAWKPVHNMAGKITQIIMADQHEYNFQLLMPLLAQLSQDDRWFAWIAPPLKLPKQWLLEAGIDINKIMMLQPSENNDTLELARKALNTGTCHAVISWPGQLDTEELEQLEQAARHGRSHAILIQPR
jgi:cell division inhibitor SulA